jgi:hypothetical protein
MVKVLELFSGTGSVGKVAKARGYDVVSLDLILPADIKVDILKWDYKSAYPPEHFDIICASPVCLWWSKLRTSWIGREIKAHPGVKITQEILDEDINTYGKPMVRKVLEIIEYFKPKFYWIENPQTGRMKEFLVNLPYYDVDYCKYVDWGYQKRTRFWTNITDFTPKICDKDCTSMENGRHKKVLGGGYCIDEDGKSIRLGSKAMRNKYRHQGKKYKSDMSKATTKHDRYRIPPLLIEDLFNATGLR